VIRQWDIWKARPPGFERDHWFVILSPQERLDSGRQAVNGLACFTLRGAPLKSDVRLNGADGFDHETVCQCDVIFLLQRAGLREKLGAVSWERQQQLKSRLKEVFRL
jgi:mRNA-degrading endonuclease toxin of MazEF toxin-antitoxin module